MSMTDRFESWGGKRIDHKEKTMNDQKIYFSMCVSLVWTIENAHTHILMNTIPEVREIGISEI